MKIKSIFKALIFIYFRLICCTKGLEPFDDICEGKHNVNIAHPDLCTHFFYCYFETPVIFHCEDPTEVFHNGECVAGDPITCEIFTTTTTTTVPPDFCEGNDFLFIADPNYCFRFYFCMLGDAIPYECEPDTIFSEELQDCIDGDWDTCEPHTTTTEPVTITDEPTTTTLSTTTTQAPPNPCDGINLRLVPDPDYCFRFYFCNFGTAVPYECAPDTIFSEETQGCIDGDWATCDPKTTTVPTTSTTQRPTGPPELCEGNNLRLIPDPDYCFRFYFCSYGTAVPFECAPGTIFIEESQDCIDGDWGTCELKTTISTPKITVTETKTSTDEISITSTTDASIQSCPPGGFGSIPHHTNCSRYFECIADVMYLRLCPDDLLFDSVTLQCTSPELAVCAGGN